MRIYDGGKADEIYSALHNFVPGDDDKAALIFSEALRSEVRIILVFYYYEDEEPPTTGPFASSSTSIRP